MTELRVPTFPAAAWPAPEARRRVLAIRLLACLALLAGVGYLSWRALATVDLDVWWLALPLLLLEAHAVVGLGLHTLGLWDVDAERPPPVVHRTPLRLAVLVPTYDEPIEVLLPTVAAATAVHLEHETWVLDDGNRPEVRELAAQLGARYIARTDRSHAKAGNINNALTVVDADVIAVLDADHVADRELFRHTLGHFVDPRVAFVQTPQDFYNLDSFEHVERRSGRRYSEQELFYRGLAAGRNAWNAAFWCGTNAVLRLTALNSVGGIATETLTEDIHTTIRLHQRGWRSVYHNEVLARGLAAGDASQYLSQRLRWGTGAMQVLRTDNPASVPGLTPHQRISYLSTLLGWFDSWRSLGYVLLPLLTLLSGALPIAAHASVFVPAFLATFLLQRVALTALGRGRAPWWQSTLFAFVRMPANLAATLSLFGRRAGSFTVTTKGRSGELRTRVGAPVLLAALLALSLAMLLWYAATSLSMTTVEYPTPWVAHVAAAWALVNLLVLLAAVTRIRAMRFAADRRASVRFPLDGPVSISALDAELRDVSLTGLQAAAPISPRAPKASESVTVILPTAAGVVVLPGVVRSARQTGSTVVLGIEYVDPPARAQAALALALFRTGIAPTLVEIPRIAA